MLQARSTEPGQRSGCLLTPHMPLGSPGEESVLNSALSSFAGAGAGLGKVSQNNLPFQQETVEQRDQFDLSLKKEEQILFSQRKK